MLAALALLEERQTLATVSHPLHPFLFALEPDSELAELCLCSLRYIPECLIRWTLHRLRI